MYRHNLFAKIIKRKEIVLFAKCFLGNIIY